MSGVRESEKTHYIKTDLSNKLRPNYGLSYCHISYDGSLTIVKRPNYSGNKVLEKT